MNTPAIGVWSALWRRPAIGIVVASVLTVAAVGEWTRSVVIATRAAEVIDSGLSRPYDEVKLGLVGSYEVTGTEPDGTPYGFAGILDITMTPSGALELEWDNGKRVGVGQVVGNVLSVAGWAKGRTMILTMNINADGSLSGKWLRRTDRGGKGTEQWTRK